VIASITCGVNMGDCITGADLTRLDMVTNYYITKDFSSCTATDPFQLTAYNQVTGKYQVQK
jgi:hypothetical protein